MKSRLILVVVCIFMIAAFTWSAGNEFNISIEKTPDLVIDGESSEYVYFINSLAVDEEGFIYLADNYSFSILKFSYDGQFISRTGSKGQGPGDFIAEPWRIALVDDHVLVTSKKMDVVYVFDKDLKYRTTWDFNFSNAIEMQTYENLLLVHSPYIQEELPLIVAEIGDDLKLRFRNKPALSPRLIWEQSKVMSVDQQGNIIIASRLEDQVEKWSMDLDLIWRKHAFKGQKIRYIKHRGEMKPDPRSVVFRSVAADSHGNVYLLGGNPREIGVMSSAGNPITVLNLPFAVKKIITDNYNRIYLVDLEGSLSRYQLNIIKTNETPGDSSR